MIDKRVFDRLGEIISLTHEEMNKLQTLSVRSKNSQMKLVGLFESVSEIVSTLDFPDDDTSDKVIDYYLKIAGEHEFSGETFNEMTKVIITFMGYMNIMYGYIMAGKDMKHNEGVNKRRKRKHWRSGGGTMRVARRRLHNGIKQGGFME